MTSEEQQKIERAIAEGYPHSSSVCLMEGLRIYRQHFRDFALFALIVPLAGSLLSLLGLDIWGTLFLTLVVSPVLNAGFYLAAASVANQEEWRFRRFFDGLPLALPLILNSLLGIVIMAIILIPMYFLFQKVGLVEWYYEVVAHPEDPPAPPLLETRESLIFFLNLVPLIYLQIGFSWAFPLILFSGANAFSALEYSRRLVTRRWWPQFMLLLTFFSMFMVASIMLSPLTLISPGLANFGTFGLFLIIPWAYCSLYVGFQNALPPPPPPEENFGW
ncbi:MAG: hypothetical protein DA408_21010 [Bacteroidetes bacterium]|nr:MAG: hypothetical protein C7N36_19900 [Bacteroidota bacterium]PTM08173.1 MAG: hypothetical protein DA408_21010 [Bacteroidota bacterium]